MNKNTQKRYKRHRMIRAKLFGTAMRPRLSVYRGNQHIYLQLINDETGKTLIGLSDNKVAGVKTGMERAKELARIMADQAKEKEISSIVFDRGGFKYHGQVKVIADTFRESGITV